MRLGFAKITSCPHCGGEKEIMSLMSGNYIGAELWSDGKLIAPMLQKPSPVQKCPHCRKYYFMPPYEETKKIRKFIWSTWFTELSGMERGILAVLRKSRKP